MLHSITVRDYMAKSVITFSPDMEMLKAINELVKKRISGAPVVDNHGNLVGMLSEKDCMRVGLDAAYNQGMAGFVRDYMSRQVTTVEIESSLMDVAKMFLDTPFKRFPVTENNRLVGQISRADVLRAIEKLY